MNKRLSLMKAVVLQFIIISFLVRVSFIIWSFSGVDFSIVNLLRTLITGLFFDFGAISFFIIFYLLHLIFLPNRWIGSFLDKSISYFFYFFTTLILTFSFFGEFTFWEEFKARYNFVAVDYLIYTNEVVDNINESYPIPLLSSIIIAIVIILFIILKKSNVFTNTFSSKISIIQKAILSIVFIVPFFYGFNIDNEDAEWSNNRYENEISKAGIYSFFAAFRNNQLDYNEFYQTQDIDLSFDILKQNLVTDKDSLISNNKYNIEREITSDSIEIYPNVIFICVESLSAEFLGHFGNDKNLTPNLDSLLQKGISFENLYATGTRTVRGMEAYTLSIPPSPGRSILKRENNRNLNNIGDVFTSKGYSKSFIYGGDGYFDNMNNFFGGNGFDIVDRGRGYLFGDSFTAKRTNIDDSEVTFENAWGVCDEDIYNKVIKEADKNYTENKPFFNFIMTTSNHRPYSYLENKIDIPSGTGRDGAVKYSDYAIGEFINLAKTKPWYKNTVFVIAADHCASSAGRQELNVAKYHIPALIFNLPSVKCTKINTQCSQIDLFPTLFGYLNWNYKSSFYGKDVNNITQNNNRAFIGNYRKLGLLKGNKLTVLSDQKKYSFYTWNKETNDLIQNNFSTDSLKEIISYYQTNDYLYQEYLKNLTAIKKDI